MKVTGSNITDEQIRRVATRLGQNSLWIRECRIALGELRTVNDPDGDFLRSRARCADAWNARQGGSR